MKLLLYFNIVRKFLCIEADDGNIVYKNLIMLFLLENKSLLVFKMFKCSHQHF